VISLELRQISHIEFDASIASDLSLLHVANAEVGVAAACKDFFSHKHAASGEGNDQSRNHGCAKWNESALPASRISLARKRISLQP
jgi:hypothetical protein